MAQPRMTIRNLTSNPIKIERYEIYDRQHGGHLSKMSKNVTSIFSKPKDPNLVCNAQENIAEEILPFGSCSLEVRPAALPKQILCIFVGIKEQLYQTNIMHARCHSQYLMAVNDDPDPLCKHITVYHPGQHHLTIAYRDSYRSWMRRLRDDIPLSALSIPGTHNSPTCHNALPSVRCQVMPVMEQLKKGVRFLDIRVQPAHPSDPLKEKLVLVHSVFPISLTGPKHFRPLVTELLEFLEDNPSETIIMSIKREGTGNATDAQLSRIMRDHYAGDVNRWFTAPRIPYLGEARGKIVLVRRFALDEGLKEEWGGLGWCINADTWADNSPNSFCPSGDVCVQDFYEVLETENINLKIQYSTEQLRRAAERVCTTDGSETKQPFYINFLTASNFWKVGCWPDRIAAKLNPAIVEYLCTKHNESDDAGHTIGDGSTGIVVCDWVGHDGNWDIVRCIIGMNAKYEKVAAT